MPRRLSPLLLFFLLTPAPAALAADNTPPTDSEIHAAYCAGYHEAHEKDLGDVCFDASAGWENECTADKRQESRELSELGADQSIYKPGVGSAIVAGQNGYRQCLGEAASAAGVAQAAECRKRYTGQQLTACMESAPAEPTCEILRACDE
jgi:hypothetical protein